jgi:hypothetical protein
VTEPLDPRALRWVEAGVSGLARSRDWDWVEVVAVPELEHDPVEELTFGALADGAAVGVTPPGVDPDVVERLAGRVRAALDGPFEAVAVRRTSLEWSVAARTLRIEELRLPALAADELVVAVGPGGEPSVLVDGDEAEAAPEGTELGVAVARLRALGGGRFDSFVVRARRLEADRWAVSVDPL